MYSLLYKYLILYKNAAIPGIGVFSIKREAAKFDFSNKLFEAPVFKINFNPDSGFADNRFYTFISSEQNIEETLAIKQFSDFAHTFKENLAVNKSIELPVLGTLLQNAEGKLHFQSAKQLEDYFPGLAVERIARHNTEQNIATESDLTNAKSQENQLTEAGDAVQSKDYWWVYAIILALISIAAIIYYYTFMN